MHPEQIKFRPSGTTLELLDQVRGTLSRPAFAKLALETAISGIIQNAQAGEPLPGLPGGLPPEPKHRPIPGRLALALVCTVCNRRQFGDHTWRCPDHPGHTAVQRNRPYLGQEVPTPKVPGLAVVDPDPPLVAG